MLPAHLLSDASRISAGVLFNDCVAALFKFFNVVVRLCSSSLQILESQSSILLSLRSVLWNNNEIGLRNSSEGRKERLYEKSDYYENLSIFCFLYFSRYCVDPIFLKTNPM